MKLYGTTFNGHEVSEYGKQHNRLDYYTLARGFDAVLCNNIFNVGDIDSWEMESGFSDYSEEIEELQEKIDALEALEELTEEQESDLQEYRDELQELEDTDDYYDAMESVYQWFIVSDAFADVLKDINQIVFYNDELDIYVWGVCHFGTSWSYVLTDVPLNCGEEAFEDVNSTTKYTV